MSAGLPFRVFGQLPALSDPTLIVMLSGWIDASGAAAAAMDSLVAQTDADVLIEFDPDTFIDYRARRPVMELREGLNSRIVWSTPEMRVGSDRAGRDVLLLVGPEPDANWKQFCTTTAEIASELGVRQMIGLGAYPVGAPHTRPVRVSCTTPDANVLDRLPYEKANIDVPAGLEAILEHSLFERGVEVMGLWAQVPHYIATMAYPAASATLVEAVAQLARLDVSSAGLRGEAAIQRERLDQLVAANAEHAELVTDLERSYDEAHPAPLLDPDDGPTDDTPINGHLPTSEELAAEVEQFLRDNSPRQGDL